MVEHAKKRGKPKAARPDKVGFAILPSERLRAIASRAPEESALLQQLVRVATAATAQDQVRELNQSNSSHAMMVHMPMPEGVDAYRIQELIDLLV